MHQMALFNGNEIDSILTSNRRNPPLSPLDRPDLLPRIVEITGDSIQICDQNTYICGSYDLKTKNWKKLTNRDAEIMSLRSSYPTDPDFYFITPDNLCVETLSHHGGFLYEYSRFSQSKAVGFEKKKSDVFGKVSMGHVRVSSPRIDHQSFSKNWFPIYEKSTNQLDEAALLWPDDPYRKDRKGWWRSPNDAIQLGLFKCVLMGKWKSHYLLGLACNGEDSYYSKNDVGTQAFWMVPEERVDAALKPVRDRFDRYFSFRWIMDLEAFKNSAISIECSDPKRFKWPANQQAELYGDGAFLKIAPAFEVKNMDFVIRLGRKSEAPLDLRIECGDPEHPTELFNSKQHELGMKRKSYWTDLYVTLPDGVKQLRLINNSPKGTFVSIEEFAFIEQR